MVLASREEVGGRLAGGTARGAGLALLSALGFGCFFVCMDRASDEDVAWAILVNRITGVDAAAGRLCGAAPAGRRWARADARRARRWSGALDIARKRDVRGRLDRGPGEPRVGARLALPDHHRGAGRGGAGRAAAPRGAGRRGAGAVRGGADRRRGSSAAPFTISCDVAALGGALRRRACPPATSPASCCSRACPDSAARPPLVPRRAAR